MKRYWTGKERMASACAVILVVAVLVALVTFGGCGGAGTSDIGDAEDEVAVKGKRGVYRKIPPDECAKLAEGLRLYATTDKGRTDWIKGGGWKPPCSALRLKYPPGQAWGAVWVAVGETLPNCKARDTRNYLSYNYLEIKIRGTRVGGGEIVSVGVKRKCDPDDGGEPMEDLVMGSQGRFRSDGTPDWETYRIPVSKFIGTRYPYNNPNRMAKLHVVCEFVFEGPTAQEVRVKSIQYRR